MMNLLEILKEQSEFNFSGKINVLLTENNQYLGSVFLLNGCIAAAAYNQFNSHKALWKMIIDNYEFHHKYKYVIEPEIIKTSEAYLSLSFDEVKKECSLVYSDAMKLKKLRPSGNLNLVINTSIITNLNEMLTKEEFEVLVTISEWSNVDEIYNKSQLLEHEITNALVGLRKKKAINVFK